jgi:DNA-binding transcriptional MerR regulator
VVDDVTYSSAEVCRTLDISYRRLDYWVRRLGWRHLQRGSGHFREFTSEDVATLMRVAKLRAEMIRLQRELEEMFEISRGDAVTSVHDMAMVR